MPDPTIALVSLSLEGDYEDLLKKLQLLEYDLLEHGSIKDAVFINNMTLRLKLWAADIDVDGGALETAEQIAPLGFRIGKAMKDLEAQCEILLLKNDVTVADYKHNFTHPMDSLNTLAEPLKTVRTSSTGETDPVAKVNAKLRELSVYPYVRVVEPSVPPLTIERMAHGLWVLLEKCKQMLHS